MRSVLDTIAASELDGIFADFLHRLQRGKQLANYQLPDGSYLVSIDGSEYFSSEHIHCPHCLVTQSKGGRARWKIENETFNTLKNQGYHIEHNFGHGQQNLSMIFLCLTFWPFMFIRSWS